MIIKRARGHRLYTTNGKKILDLSMDMGRAVIGHRPNGLSLAIKNVIERGLYSRYDNIYKGRLIKELNKRFPEYTYVTFLEHEDKVKSFFNKSIHDPLFEDVNGKELAYWRPFLETPNAKHLVLLYPLPGLNTTTVLLSKESVDLKSRHISPILMSGILRSMYDYEIELQSFKLENYNVFDSIPNAEIKAPYLLFKKTDKEYSELVLKALESGILLNEDSKFAVLTTGFSHGEINKIKDVLG